MGCSKKSKKIILGAKFAEKFTILYKQTKTYLNETIHSKLVLEHEGQK